MRWFDRRPVDWDGHLVLVHDNEQERRAGVAAWTRRGLDLGAKIIYIEPPDQPPERSFLGVLRDRAVAVDGALARGQIQVFTADEEVYCPDWQDDVVETELAAGYSSVRWSGEATTAWSVMTPSVHADIEWATDQLCDTRPVSILCQYSAQLPQAMLQTVCAMHGAGIRESQLETSPIRGGVALSGSVDASNQRVLRTALLAASAVAPERSTVLVDLSGLDFLDVAGARAFLTGTTTHRIRGGSITLRAPQRPVESLLRLLRVDRADGFRLEASR